MRRAIPALVFCILTACGPDPYGVAAKADTIEAYEDYLANNEPEQNKALMANVRLEELYLEKAKADGSLDSYDVYLERFPKGSLLERGLSEREQFLFQWAIDTSTADGWQKFLDEYPRADKKRKQKARAGIRLAGYRDNIELGAPTLRELNMAEDPEGEMDGLGWQLDVTNKGDKTLKRLELTIEYLGADGAMLDRDEWPVVTDNWGVPMPEEFYGVLKPGETRVWDWNQAKKRLPEGYDGTATKVIVTSVYFEE